MELGDTVAATDIAGENLTNLESVYPDLLKFYHCDVSDPKQVNSIVNKIIPDWDTIDILINNACVAHFSTLHEKPDTDIRHEFDVNYFGYLNLIWAVFEHLEATGTGIIHNVSSSVGISGFPGLTGYASSKGAIEALTRTLAMELASVGITLNRVHPPLTQTNSASKLGIPEQMMAKPEEVGLKLARKIGSTRSIITPDVFT